MYLEYYDENRGWIFDCLLTDQSEVFGISLERQPLLLAQTLARLHPKLYRICEGTMKTLTRGLTTIYFNEDETVKRIEHAGNMGDSLEDVRRDVDALLGEGTFFGFQKVGKASGCPEYLYTLDIKSKKS